MLAPADGARMAEAVLGTAAFARAHGVVLPADLLLDLERVQAMAKARGWQVAAKGYTPRPAQVARLATKQVTTFADDPLDEERRDGERLIQAAMYLFFASQWIRLRRQLRANRGNLEAARKVRRQIAILIGLDWGQEQGRLWAGLAPVLDGVIGTAKKSIWVQLADLGVELAWDVYDRAAEQWALKYRYDLVTRINSSTQTMLGRTISRWIASDQDFDELVEKVWRLIPTNPYPNMIDRPRVIAQTETTRVYAESRMAGLKAAGLHKMVWQTANDERVCKKICVPLHNREGSIEMGVLNPENGRYYKAPAHVNCRCWILPSTDELEARAGMKPYPLPTMPGEAAKHAGPGDHPGTGTPQSVHGGGGGGEEKGPDWLKVLFAAGANMPQTTGKVTWSGSSYYWLWAGIEDNQKEALEAVFAVNNFNANVYVTEYPDTGTQDISRAEFLAEYFFPAGEYAGEVRISLSGSFNDKITIDGVSYNFPEKVSQYLQTEQERLEISLRTHMEPATIQKLTGWVYGANPLTGKPYPVDLAPIDEEYYSDRENKLRWINDDMWGRGDIKENGERHLVDDTGWPHGRRFQDAWHHTANDDGAEQDMLHLVAWQKAGSSSDVQFTSGMARAREATERADWQALHGGIPEKAYESIKRRTQEHFARFGLGPDDEIVLYRGMVFKMDESPELAALNVGQEVKLEPRPLSAFSVSPQIADGFSYEDSQNSGERGFVFGVRVPVKAIFSHWSTGFGCAAEDEIVVEGAWLKDLPMEVIRIHDRYR